METGKSPSTSSLASQPPLSLPSTQPASPFTAYTHPTALAEQGQPAAQLPTPAPVPTPMPVPGLSLAPGATQAGTQLVSHSQLASAAHEAGPYAASNTYHLGFQSTSTASPSLPQLASAGMSQPAPLPSLHQPQTGARVKASPTGQVHVSAASMAFPQLGRLHMSPSRSASRAAVDPFAGNESLDLDTLAKAAVQKRKEQEHNRAEAAAREHVIAEVQRRAAHQAATWAAAQQLAINWLQVTVNADDADYIQQHMETVQGILSKAGLFEPAVPQQSNADLTEPAGKGAVAGLNDVPALTSAGNQVGQGHTSLTHSAAASEAAVGRATAAAQAAVLNASAADASAATAAVNSAAAVAVLQATAVDSDAPAAVVASAISDAARALAEAKAKATATAEAALQAAVAQQQQKVIKRASEQLFPPLTQGLGLVDYPSDDDSHMSRAMSDTQGETAAAPASRLPAPKSNLGPQAKSGAPRGLPSLLPMYSGDLSGTVDSDDQEAEVSGKGSLAPGQTAHHRAGLLGPVQQPSALPGLLLGEVLDSLQELGSVHMNLGLLQTSGVLPFVNGLRQCSEPSVAYMAKAVSDQWQRSLAFHLHTVTQPNPDVDLYQQADTLIQQFAQRWNLALPVAQEVDFGLPPYVTASQAKNKKRKRDDSKKAPKGTAAFLRASGSAPEAQTLHQLSQAKQAEAIEARRLKRDLHTLNADPATASPAQFPASLPRLPPSAPPSSTKLPAEPPLQHMGLTPSPFQERGIPAVGQAGQPTTQLPALAAAQPVPEQATVGEATQRTGLPSVSEAPSAEPAASAAPADLNKLEGRHRPGAAAFETPLAAEDALQQQGPDAANAAAAVSSGHQAIAAVQATAQASAAGQESDAGVDAQQDQLGLGDLPSQPAAIPTAKQPLSKKRKATAKQKSNAKRQKQANAAVAAANPPRPLPSMSPAAAATAEAKKAAAALAAQQAAEPAAGANADDIGLTAQDTVGGDVQQQIQAEAPNADAPAAPEPDTDADADGASDAAPAKRSRREITASFKAAKQSPTGPKLEKKPNPKAPKGKPASKATKLRGPKGKAKATPVEGLEPDQATAEPSGEADKAAAKQTAKQQKGKPRASDQATEQSSAPEAEAVQTPAANKKVKTDATAVARQKSGKGKAGKSGAAAVGKLAEVSKKQSQGKTTTGKSAQASAKQKQQDAKTQKSGKGAEGMSTSKAAASSQPAYIKAARTSTASKPPARKPPVAKAGTASKPKLKAAAAKAAQKEAERAAAAAGADEEADTSEARDSEDATGAVEEEEAESDTASAVADGDVEEEAAPKAGARNKSTVPKSKFKASAARAGADEKAKAAEGEEADGEAEAQTAADDEKSGSAAAGSDSEAISDDEAARQSEAGQPGVSAQSETTEAADSPVALAVALLKDKLEEVARCDFPDLKPLAEAASQGALKHLSSLPGWKRQSARKKQYAAAEAALHTNLSKHKMDWADATKKRAKREAKKLLSDLVESVQALQ